MPVMDEFKEERAALKQGTFKQKARYVWDYYRWYFIGGAIAAVCLFTLVRDIVTHKDAGFYACMLNGAQIDVFAEETENMKNFAPLSIRRNIRSCSIPPSRSVPRVRMTTLPLRS